MTSTLDPHKIGQDYLVHLAGYRNGAPLVDQELKDTIKESNQHTFTKGFLDAGKKLICGGSLLAALSPFVSMESRASILNDKHVCAYFPQAAQKLTKTLDNISEFINSFGFSSDLSAYVPFSAQSTNASSRISDFIPSWVPGCNQTLQEACTPSINSHSLLERVGIRTVNYLSRLQEKLSTTFFYPDNHRFSFYRSGPNENFAFLLYMSYFLVFGMAIYRLDKGSQMKREVIKKLKDKFELAGKELSVLYKNAYTPEAKEQVAALADDILFNKQMTLEELDVLGMPLTLTSEVKTKLFAKVEKVAQRILDYT